MSVFSLPRVHFWGTQKVNAGTANNDTISPGAEASITSDTERVQPQDIGLDDDAFRTWIRELDQTGLMLRSQWNLYGDMGHEWLDVRVRSVQTAHDRVVTDPSADPLVGGRVNLGYAVVCDNNPEGFNTTQIFSETIEVRAPEALGGTGTFVSRKPTRATTRGLNWYRNVSYHGCLGDQTSGGAGGASASFQCAIPVEKEDLKPTNASGPEYDAMRHRFLASPNSHGALALAEALGREDVQGLVCRYNLYLCYPRISDPDLSKAFLDGAMTENPAIGWVVGTIAPWLVGEPASISMGRWLKPSQSFVNPYRTDHKPYFLAPVTAFVDPDAQVVSIDVANTFPEDGPEGQKYSMGDVELGVRRATAPDTDPMENDGHITRIGLLDNTKEAYETRGGMVDIPYGQLDKEDRARVESGEHELVIQTSVQGLLLYETEYMVASDSGCNYMDQPATGKDWDDDDVQAALAAQPFGPLTGKVPVFSLRRGRPIEKPFRTRFEQWQMTPTGDPKNYGFYQYPILLGSDEVECTGPSFEYAMHPLNGTGVRMYRMVPEGQWPQHMSPEVLDNSFAAADIFSLRVLPYDDYSGISEEELDFDLVYREVFRYYDLILPAMSKRLDMSDATIWNTPTAARYLMVTTDLRRWAYYDYMPRTRDLSGPRRALLQRFAQKVLADYGGGESGRGNGRRA